MSEMKTYGDFLEVLREPMSELPNLPRSLEKNELERDLEDARKKLRVLSPNGQRIPHETILTPEMIDAGSKARETYDKYFAKK